MKLDIARAWKDEQYRQALSEDQRNALPVNPVGELSEAEMEMVCGGGGGGGGGFVAPAAPAAPIVHHAPVVVHHPGGPVVVGTSAAAASETRVHSFGLLCDVSIFSVNLLTIPIIPIVSPTTQCCSSCD